MALPLKSGADLYTHELLRARLHNFDGDLAEYGTGSIYFNTTSGLNTSDRIRYRGLTNWHSVANLEDIAHLEEMIGNLNFAGSEDFIGITSRVAALEGNFTNGAAKDAVKFGGQLPSYYATQSAFSALQDKVNAFLDGDVDSDAVLENLKEIQAFLDSYDGATSLVDLLDTKLSGYLPLSGGTMKGVITMPINNQVQWGDSSYMIYGGNNYIQIFAPTGLMVNSNVVLHTGNFNSYAPTLTGVGASGTWGIDISGKSDSFNPQQITTADLGSEALINRFFVTRNGAQTDMPTGFMVGFTMSADSNPSYCVQFGMSPVGTIYTRATHGASTYGDWKVVAFTDSDITGNAASATKLATARTIWGQSFDGTADVSGSLFIPNSSAICFKDASGNSRIVSILNNGNELSYGYGTALAGYGTFICGNSLSLKYGTSATTGLILNDKGSVTIGATDLATTSCKLYVDGSLKFTRGNTIHAADREVISLGEDSLIIGRGYAWAGKSVDIAGNYITFSYGGGPTKGMILSAGGYVGIGTTSPAYILDVNGIGNFGGGVRTAGQVVATSGFMSGDNGGFGFHSEPAWYGLTSIAIGANRGLRIAGFGGIGVRIFQGFSMYPTNNAVNDLGTASNCWRSVFASTSVKIGDATLSWDSTSNALKVDKDFYSDGQVSSGGVAEEGTGGAVGGSGLERVVFTIPANTTTFDCVHNLGTREISVAIYEEGNDYQQILTDVYLDSTNIARVVFGSATDVAHKVVIIG